MRNSQLIWKHPLSFMFIMPTVTRYFAIFSKPLTYPGSFIDILSIFILLVTISVQFADVVGPYSRGHALGSVGW